MTNGYATAMSGWEGWQREYRFGVLLIYPPDPIRSIVDDLRSRYDPRSHAACRAHISLTVAAPRPISMNQWSKIEVAASTIEPFTIRVGPFRTHPPHSGVTLNIEPQSRLDELRAAVEALAPFNEAPARKWPFTAHVTIAEFVDMPRTNEIMAELASSHVDEAFTCSHLSHAVPDESFRFTERRRLDLT